MVAQSHRQQQTTHRRHGHAPAAAGEEVLEVHAAHGLPVLAVRAVARLTRRPAEVRVAVRHEAVGEAEDAVPQVEALRRRELGLLRQGVVVTFVGGFTTAALTGMGAGAGAGATTVALTGIGGAAGATTVAVTGIGSWPSAASFARRSASLREYLSTSFLSPACLAFFNLCSSCSIFSCNSFLSFSYWPMVIFSVFWTLR